MSVHSSWLSKNVPICWLINAEFKTSIKTFQFSFSEHANYCLNKIQNLMSIWVLCSKDLITFFISSLPLGYGFLEFGDDQTALRALHKCNGKAIPNSAPVSFVLSLQCQKSQRHDIKVPRLCVPFLAPRCLISKSIFSLKSLNLRIDYSIRFHSFLINIFHT